MEIEEISHCLLNGGVVLLPTDTVYGVAASPLKPQGVEKIYSLKARPRQQNLPIMVANVQDLETLGVDLNPIATKILNSDFVPGDISLVLGFKDQPLVPWLEGRDEIAIRIPNDERLLEVLKKTGPLLVTSANLHGKDTPSTVQEILLQLNGSPDLVIDGGVVENTPSTIVNCRLNPPTIQRGENPLHQTLVV